MSLRMAVLYVLVPALIYLSLRRPLWGVYSLMLMYYFRPDVWDRPVWWRPVEWLSISTFISWVIHGRGVRIPAMLVTSVILLFTMVISSEAAVGSRDKSYDATLTILKLVFAQFLVIQVITDVKILRQFLWVNIIANLWTLKSTLVQTITGGEARVNVGAGQGGGSNYLAMLFVMGLPILYFRYLHGSRFERKLAIMIAPLYTIAVVGTGSRGGFLTLFFIMGFLAVRSGKKMAGFLTILIIGTTFVVMVPDAKWDRFVNTFTSEGKGSAKGNSRLLFWEAGMKMFKNSPITGVGHDNFQVLSPRAVGFFAGKSPIPYDPSLEGRKGYTGFVAHSIWVQSLADGGLIGSIPFFSLFIIAFFTLYRVRRRRYMPGTEKEIWVASQILEGVFWAFCIGSSFASHFKIDFLWWYFGAVAALGLIAEQEASRYRAFIQAQFAEVARPQPDAEPATAGR